MEEWRDIEGYEGIYQVSNEGRVKSLERYVGGNGRNQCLKLIKEKILNGILNAYGYPTVTLHDENGQQKAFRVHRLVAKAFIPNPDNKPYIDHINTVRNDNRVENLRWCTQKENCNNPITYRKILKHVKSKKHREVASKANKGKIITEETKKKISEARIGIGSIPICQYTLDGEFIKKYSSIEEASKENHIGNGDIIRCCKGGRYLKVNGQMKWYNITKCGGYKWKYAEEI